MQVYVVAFKNPEVFSVKQDALDFAGPKCVEYVREVKLDGKVTDEQRATRLNHGYFSRPMQARPAEDCLLIGDESRRGRIEGFEELAKAVVSEVAGPRYRSLFKKDNFNSRRTTGHNLLDPDSTITGAELEAGFTYKNSFRDFPDQETYERAARGYMTINEVVQAGPRKKYVES